MRIAVILTAIVFVIGCTGDVGKESSPIENLRGQWLLVNYWAEWCKPCIEEIPELNELDHARTDVSVLGVNFEGATGAELAGKEERLGIAFPTIEDPAAELGIDRPAVLPTTLLVNPQGELVDTLIGPQTTATLQEAIAGHAVAQDADAG